MKILIIVTPLLLLASSIFAQSSKEKDIIRSKRFSRVEMRHIGVGVETGIYHNLYIGPKFYYGIGSFRNIINIDGGLKYLYCVSLDHQSTESLSAHFFSVFGSLNLNPIRWNSGCLYVGSEISYNLVASANHKLTSSELETHDNRIGENHFVLRGKMGARLNLWDFNVFFDYNLAPAMNQKYIYESINFDYDQLYSSIHERYRLGVAVSYFIPF